MKRQLRQVKQFHDTFGANVEGQPIIPDEGRKALRLSLMREELSEIEEAFANNDIVAAADGFADLLYVTFGSILECGLADKMRELFDEVHRSNMTKACSSPEEADDTIFHICMNDVSKEITDFEVVELIKGHFVVKRKDGKIMKNKNFVKPSLEEIITRK